MGLGLYVQPAMYLLELAAPACHECVAWQFCRLECKLQKFCGPSRGCICLARAPRTPKPSWPQGRPSRHLPCSCGSRMEVEGLADSPSASVNSEPEPKPVLSYTEARRLCLEFFASVPLRYSQVLGPTFCELLGAPHTYFSVLTCLRPQDPWRKQLQARMPSRASASRTLCQIS